MNKSAEVGERLFSLVALIPIGKVTTYGALAKKIGIHPRQVGYWLHQNKNPLAVPCHRVVNSKGKLAKSYAFGGLTQQAKKLQSEGLIIVKGDRVKIDQPAVYFCP